MSIRYGINLHIINANENNANEKNYNQNIVQRQHKEIELLCGSSYILYKHICLLFKTISSTY